MSLMYEINKIPPVTRFLCGASLVITVPVMMRAMSPYHFYFIWDNVVRNMEVWRVPSSFFFGTPGLNYIFEMIMLYRNSDQLESLHYAGRAADLVWQIFLSCWAIMALCLPFQALVHFKAFLVMLTWMTAQLSPAGTQTSLFGLLTIPIVYLPYAIILMDFIMFGPAAAATSLTGAIVGHLWWWGVWHTQRLERVGRAPDWMKSFFANTGRVETTTQHSGVHVTPSVRVREQQEVSSGGHKWGSGNRLGTQ